MNFVKFDEMAVNLDNVTAFRLRQNKNDGSFRNKADYPYAVDFFTGGEKPFTVHLTDQAAKEFRRIAAASDLSEGRR